MKQIFLLISILLVSSICNAQKEKIQLNLVKGETYSQSVNSNLDVTQDFAGQSIAIKMNVSGKMNYKVLDAVDTIYNVEVKYESLGLKMDVMGNSMSYSSDNANDMFGKIMKAMTSKSFFIKMSTKGKIIEIKNIENLFEVFSAFTELNEAQKQQLKTMMAESYGEKAFKGNLEMSSAIFPATAVSKGDSWTVNTALESKMSMNLQNTFTLKEVTDSYYIITSSALLTPDPTSDFVSVNGMQLKYNLKGTMMGELKIDKKTGWTISGSYDQNLNGVNTIKSPAGGTENMEVPMKMTNKMVFSNN